MDTPDEEKLSLLFEQWGASREQALVLASQLLKRAGQMAEEKGVSKVEALDYLLKVTAAGKEGIVYEGPKPGETEEKK